MPYSQGVQVRGLNELQARLRQAAVYSPNEIRKVVRSVAQIVVDETIPIMESQFVTDPRRRDGQLEVSLRASASASGRGISAKVIEGRVGGEQSSGSYAGVWEFGGYPGKRPFIKEGRALLPTVKKNREKLIAAVEVAMDALAKMIEGD